MDNWLRFQYHRKSFERSGDAEGQAERAAGRARPSSEAGVQANPHTVRLGCDGEEKAPKLLISHCQEKPLVRP